MPMFDPFYFLVVGPFMLLSAWASWRVKSQFDRFSAEGTRAGLTGADVARRILASRGIGGVGVEAVDGYLSDHYDPQAKVLRLSPNVYHGRSIAALGVAAHEVGHAVQDAERYAWLGFRSMIAKPAMIGTNLGMIVFMVGMVMGGAGSLLGRNVLLLGVAMFGLAALFTIVTLPVEFDASRRAMAALETGGYLRADELDGAKSVLNAAAMTYVAAAATAIATLVYFLLRSGLLGGRRSEE
jgi:Zn-dependent membrane protease YugP